MQFRTAESRIGRPTPTRWTIGTGLRSTHISREALDYGICSSSFVGFTARACASLTMLIRLTLRSTTAAQDRVKIA